MYRIIHVNQALKERQYNANALARMGEAILNPTMVGVKSLMRIARDQLNNTSLFKTKEQLKATAVEIKDINRAPKEYGIHKDIVKHLKDNTKYKKMWDNLEHLLNDPKLTAREFSDAFLKEVKKASETELLDNELQQMANEIAKLNTLSDEQKAKKEQDDNIVYNNFVIGEGSDRIEMNAGTIEEHEAFMEKFETVNGKRLYGKELRAHILRERIRRYNGGGSLPQNRRTLLCVS